MLLSVYQRREPTLQMASLRILSFIVSSSPFDQINSVVQSLGCYATQARNADTAAVEHTPLSCYRSGKAIAGSDAVPVRLDPAADALEEAFMLYWIREAGAAFNTWGKKSVKAREIGEAKYSVSIEILSFLQALATSAGPWSKALASALSKAMDDAKASLSVLNEVTAEEIREGASTPLQSIEAALDEVYGLLAFFAGGIDGVHTGAKALHVDSNGLSEECVVISPAQVPDFDRKKDKDLAKLWGDLSNYGDALLIMHISQPGQLLLVPRTQLSSIAGKRCLEPLGEFLQAEIGVDRLMDFFTAITALDVLDKRRVLLPKVEKKEVQLTFESTHPYAGSFTALSYIYVYMCIYPELSNAPLPLCPLPSHRLPGHLHRHMHSRSRELHRRV
jgi:hypothetical protein